MLFCSIFSKAGELLTELMYIERKIVIELNGIYDGREMQCEQLSSDQILY